MSKRRCLLVAVAALACGTATDASGEVHVEGNLNALRVSTSGDTLSDVLSAFGTRLPVKYRTAVPLNAEVNTIPSKPQLLLTSETLVRLEGQLSIPAGTALTGRPPPQTRTGADWRIRFLSEKVVCRAS